MNVFYCLGERSIGGNKALDGGLFLNGRVGEVV